MGDPGAVDLFGHAKTALIQAVQDLRQPLREIPGHAARRDLRAVFEGIVNERFQCLSRHINSEKGFIEVQLPKSNYQGLTPTGEALRLSDAYRLSLPAEPDDSPRGLNAVGQSRHE